MVLEKKKCFNVGNNLEVAGVDKRTSTTRPHGYPFAEPAR